MNIRLNFQNGYRWHSRQGIHFKGYFRDTADRIYEGSQAVDFFSKIHNTEELANKIHELSGCFTVIIEIDGAVIAGTDSMGFFPIFYTLDSMWTVSDDWHNLVKKVIPKQLNANAIPEFYGGGFVTGSETLAPGIFKIRPGEVIALSNDGTSKSKTYFRFLLHQQDRQDYRIFKDELSRNIAILTQNIVKALNGRTAVIPLSGGFDSRLIACMLKSVNYRNVICVTYGKPNIESELSRKVAEKLGYRWVFINYNDLDVNGFSDDEIFREYVHYIANGTSMPYLQEYFAVKEIKEKQLVPDDAVFLPGHPGTSLAGSNIDKFPLHNYEEGDALQYLNEQYFYFSRLSQSQKKTISYRLRQHFSEVLHETQDKNLQWGAIVDDWEIKERTARFIFNSAHVFPYFGYQVRFPFWEQELKDFFKDLPLNYTSAKKMYREVIEENYFGPLGVSFGKGEIDDRPVSPVLKKIKASLRPFVPGWVLKKKLAGSDWTNYRVFTKELEKKISNRANLPADYQNYNAIICWWYVDYVEKYLKEARTSSEQSDS